MLGLVHRKTESPQVLLETGEAKFVDKKTRCCKCSCGYLVDLIKRMISPKDRTAPLIETSRVSLVQQSPSEGENTPQQTPKKYVTLGELSAMMSPQKTPTSAESGTSVQTPVSEKFDEAKFDLQIPSSPFSPLIIHRRKRIAVATPANYAFNKVTVEELRIFLKDHLLKKGCFNDDLKKAIELIGEINFSRATEKEFNSLFSQVKSNTLEYLILKMEYIRRNFEQVWFKAALNEIGKHIRDLHHSKESEKYYGEFNKYGNFVLENPNVIGLDQDSFYDRFFTGILDFTSEADSIYPQIKKSSDAFKKIFLAAFLIELQVFNNYVLGNYPKEWINSLVAKNQDILPSDISKIDQCKICLSSIEAILALKLKTSDLKTLCITAIVSDILSRSFHLFDSSIDEENRHELLTQLEIIIKQVEAQEDQRNQSQWLSELQSLQNALKSKQTPKRKQEAVETKSSLSLLEVAAKLDFSACGTTEQDSDSGTRLVYGLLQEPQPEAKSDGKKED